jgi:hypothetical protein
VIFPIVCICINNNKHKEIAMAKDGMPSEFKIRQALRRNGTGIEDVKEVAEEYVEALDDSNEVLSAAIDGEIVELDAEQDSSDHGFDVNRTSPGDFARLDDPSLTDLEKDLTKRQFEFCVEYAKTLKGRQSAIAAGYSKANAAKAASEMLKLPKIRDAVKALMPRERRLAGLSRDWVLDKLVTIANRSLQEIPVINDTGVPTGYYTYDANTALKALDQIAKVTGMQKDSVEISGKQGAPVEIESREVKMNIIGIADRLKRKGLKDAKE